MGYGAEFAAAAAIAAAIAASATTAVTYASGNGPDNLNDAFGDWIESFFKSFAIGSATAGIGGAVSEASQAPAAGADADMWYGMSEAQASQAIAETGTGTATEVAKGAGEVGGSVGAQAANVAEAMEAFDPMLGQEGINYAASPEGSPGYAENQLAVAEELPSGLTEFLKSPVKEAQRRLIGWGPYQVDEFNQYSDVAETAGEFIGPSYSQQDQMRKQQQQMFSDGLAGMLAGSGARNPFTNQATQQGYSWLQQQQPQQSFGTALGQGYGAGFDIGEDFDNNYWGGYYG